ncbi:MAG: ATP-binding protein [Betaproteobacteria bacterium]
MPRAANPAPAPNPQPTPNPASTAPANLAELRQRAHALHLPGQLAHWDEAASRDWPAQLIDWAERERARRSLERRLRDSRVGSFKPLTEFDWLWPKRCDRQGVEELMGLAFLREAANVILIDPNGTGKSTIARNLVYQALRDGHSALFISAGSLLGELAATDSASTLSRRLRHFAAFDLLCIDELGYLSYSNRHADLLFELTNRRYELRSTIITTNRPFAQWHEVFPNAACVVSLVDRLLHKAEVIAIEGESYRLKEAKQRAAERDQRRKGKPKS